MIIVQTYKLRRYITNNVFPNNDRVKKKKTSYVLIMFIKEQSKEEKLKNMFTSCRIIFMTSKTQRTKTNPYKSSTKGKANNYCLRWFQN